MPRKKLISTDQFPYHIYNRSNNKEFFYLPLDDLWSIFLEVLTVLKKELNINIHSFVLMNNHYHLILSTPKENLSAAMTYLHREVAKKANRKACRVNHFFGSRYKWSLIQTEEYYWNATKYVFRNPIKAKICSRVEEYDFSSLTAQNNLWSMVDFFNKPDQKITLDLDWLNLSYSEEENESIQKALNKRIFKLSRNKNGFKKN